MSKEEGLYNKPFERKQPFQNLLYIITENPNALVYNGTLGVKELIHFARKMDEPALRDIITDDNLLKFRKTDGQIAVMKTYLVHPSKESKYLATDEEVLQALTNSQQLQAMEVYAQNPTEEEFMQLKDMVHKMYQYKISISDVESERKIPTGSSEGR